ncbi:hypothetical protein ZEAMMB73_Zm00001d005163 [Zea mays]|uniref:Uncharacterized protein n=1 Tax=Zea mays TaxID=4577 RepID=A0A1D6EKT1_MAIZE|nr:hypothetical protein ZEAMMB73_Zm00001d005163 [Zea mays]
MAQQLVSLEKRELNMQKKYFKRKCYVLGNYVKLKRHTILGILFTAY